MGWINIEFINGSNPYICTTEKEFKRIQRKYILEKKSDITYTAKSLRKDKKS